MILETSLRTNICCGEEVISSNWKQDKGNHSVEMGICPKCKKIFLNKITSIAKVAVVKPVKKVVKKT